MDGLINFILAAIILQYVVIFAAAAFIGWLVVKALWNAAYPKK